MGNNLHHKIIIVKTMIHVGAKPAGVPLDGIHLDSMYGDSYEALRPRHCYGEKKDAISRSLSCQIPFIVL